jgi:ribose transport system permease protein
MKKITRPIISFLKEYALMIMLPAGIFMLMGVVFYGKVGIHNVPSLLKQAIAPAVLGWGVLFNMKVGNWDFSVGSTVLLSAITGGNLAIRFQLGIPGMIVLCMLVGLVCGLLVGLIYYLLKIPSIIVTIGVLLVYESVAGYIFGGTGVFLPSSWTTFSSLHLYLIAVAAALFAYFIFYQTGIGYHVRAVGNNAAVAMANGLNAYRIKVVALVLAGLFAGMYAFISLGSSSVQKTVSSMGTMGICFDAMMCVFVGISISRRGNLIAGIYCGSVVMQLIKLSLMVFGFPSEYNSIVIAVFVLIFMTIDAREKKSRPAKLKNIYQLEE